MTETTIQSWKGLDDPVDLAVMMHVMYHVRASERKELFKKLHEQWLTTGGRVVVVSAIRTKCPGSADEICARLGTEVLSWEEIEHDILEAGFVKQHAHEMECTQNFSNLDEPFLSFYQHHIDQPVTLDNIRKTIEEVFPDGKSGEEFYTIAVFQKV